MRPTRHTRFVESERDLRALDAKVLACPHCGLYGTLNAHGWLSGYAEIGSARIVRGRRLYCSRRFRRPGCGRTLSVLFGNMLAGFTVTTRTLARFVFAVVAGACRKAAWERAAGAGLSLRSGYRLWERLDRAQAALRTRLCRISAPPPTHSVLPMAQLITHLSAIFGSAEHALSRFQRHFQVSLFD
jgi:hypothetical protein